MKRTRPIVAASTAVVVIAATAAVYWFWVRSALPAHPLGWAPSNAVAVAQIQVKPVTSSRLWADLKRVYGGEGEGIEGICGTDPLDTVRDVIFVVLADTSGRPGGVAVIARGTFGESSFECAEKVVRADGGTLERIEIEGFPAMASAHGTTRAILLDDETVVGGSEQTVREILAVVRGDKQTALDDAELREAWESRDDEPICGVARLPSTWTEDLSIMVGGELMSVQTLALGAHADANLQVDLSVRTTNAAALERGLRTLTQGLGLHAEVTTGSGDVRAKATLSREKIFELGAAATRAR